MDVVAVAAVGENLAIGLDGELPWEHIPEDKRQYRQCVEGHPVILGRRTFESMRDALPGRRQIVVSQSRDAYPEPSVHVVDGVDAALELAEAQDSHTVYVLGGAAIYALFFPVFDRMVLSRIPGTYEADVYFPAWDAETWSVVSTTEYDAFTLEIWERTD